jgi:CO/xanthine dehydrogenase Mo-binding subunit
MGVGFALEEEMLFDQTGADQPEPDQLHHADLARHARDRVDIVDSYDPTGPFGAKGVGEPTCVSRRRICNAIHDAVGVRVTSAACDC